jgi:hypothetical protein
MAILMMLLTGALNLSFASYEVFPGINSTPPPCDIHNGDIDGL